MKLFQSLFTVMMVATISFSTFASSNNDDWELIATKTVNFQTETDTVTPNSLLKNRNFSKIKIKCIQGTVDLKDIKVTMTDGSEKNSHQWARSPTECQRELGHYQERRTRNLSTLK